MKIREAKENELQEIMFFYSTMCEELGKKEFLPEGNKGGGISFTGDDSCSYKKQSVICRGRR